ncbi:MAG: histidine kinase dimerization/phospho-acceptor domain-containing protein [Dokdonella sp.]
MKLRSASLRWRVTLAFGLLGAVLSGLFAWATTFITEHYENVLVDGMLTGFAEDIDARREGQPGHLLALPQTHTLQGYLRKADGSGSVPEAYLRLPPGFTEIELGDDSDIHLGVFDLGGDRLYLAINEADVEPLETDLELILGAIVLFGTAIAGWLGWLLAGRTIAPVRRLAEAVEALPAHAQETRLARLVAADELGRLAAAIDGYQQRLVETEARERAFFADASHELRTPLSVVCGSTELLLEDGHLTERAQVRLQRLQRGVLNLADLLEVLLGLARGKSGPVERIDTEAWLTEVLAELRRDNEISVDVAADASHISVRPREAGLVLRSIVRRLGRSEPSVRIRLRVSAGSLSLDASPADSAAADPIEHSGSGDRRLGATLAGRLATQMGWAIDDSRLNQGRIAIAMSDPPA